MEHNTGCQLTCRVARKLLLEPTMETEVEGPVQFIHQWIDMSQVGQHNKLGYISLPTKAPVTLANGSTSHTCPPALGYSFAAGTTDGPGEFDFTQVITCSFKCGPGCDYRKPLLGLYFGPAPRAFP